MSPVCGLPVSDGVGMFLVIIVIGFHLVRSQDVIRVFHKDPAH